MAKQQENSMINEVPQRRKRKKASGGIMQLPLTPMIDVTFQLLLYFILTSEFRMAEGQIAGTVPQQGEVSSVPDLNAITIIVDVSDSGTGASYSIKAGTMVVSVSGAEELFRKLDPRPNKDRTPVTIQPTSGVPWGHVVEAFNQVVRAKFEKAGFALSW